jgi:hypothetical protein
MEDMESKLGAILSNPQMMQQIMSLAQNFQSEPEPQPAPVEAAPEIDFAMIQKISSLIGKTGIDNRQKNLLQALAPYLSGQRIQKLEKAMRAARLAGMASTFFGNIG